MLCHLKQNNTLTRNVLWNGNVLDDQELQEHYTRIENTEISRYGYECSSCDPLLCLVAQLYNVNIIHNFNGTRIKYTNINHTKTLKFKSNKIHFWVPRF